METTNKIDDTHLHQLGCMLLGFAAMAASLTLSVLTGLQTAQSPSGKLAMVAVGVLGVLGTHSLLTLCRHGTIAVRALSGALWLACISYVFYSHSTFFLLTQQQAGQSRSAEVSSEVQADKPTRSLALTLFDQARLKADLVKISWSSCVSNCAAKHAKAEYLKGQIDALLAEADTAKRWQAKVDHQEEVKESLRANPFAARLATWSGVDVTQFELLASIVFTIVLDGVGCLCWYAFFQLRERAAAQVGARHVTHPPTSPIAEASADFMPRPMTAVMTETVTQQSTEIKKEAEDSHMPATCDEAKIAELVRAVQAGKLRPTVDDVRAYCRCARIKAIELTRQLKKALSDLEKQAASSRVT